MEATRIVLYTYDLESEGCFELKKALEAQLGEKVRTAGAGSTVKMTRTKPRIFCWGKVQSPNWAKNIPFYTKIYNGWMDNSIKANKLKAFARMKEAGVRTVPWTQNYDTARRWLKDQQIVVARETLHGNSSQGIRIITPDKELPNCNLYTKYIPHKTEYRVHVVNGQAVDVIEKRKSRTEGNKYVFCHDTGGLFCRDGITVPPDAREAGIAATKAVGLDFGAVDMVYNSTEKKCYVLEINSAPGFLPTEARAVAKGLIVHADFGR